MDTGSNLDRGQGEGLGFNLNIPLPPGSGHVAYVAAMNKLIEPSIRMFKPDLIIVACGFDASGVDPLSRMLCGADTFKEMTKAVMQLARHNCGGKVVMAHEGGLSLIHI